MCKSLRTKILFFNKLIILLSFFPSLLYAAQIKPIESLDINTDEGLYEAFNRCSAYYIVNTEQIKKNARQDYRLCMGSSKNLLDDMNCEFEKVMMDGVATEFYENPAVNFGKWSIAVAMDLFPNVSFEFVKNNAVNSVRAYSETYTKMGSFSDLEESKFCLELKQKYPPDDED